MGVELDVREEVVVRVVRFADTALGHPAEHVVKEISHFTARLVEAKHPLRQASCRLKFSIFGVGSEDNVKDEQ